MTKTTRRVSFVLGLMLAAGVLAPPAAPAQDTTLSFPITITVDTGGSGGGQGQGG